MKRGEKAVFTIRSDYAYGAEGSGDKIPGNATLVFEVELLRWNEKEITPDGGVYLKVFPFLWFLFPVSTPFCLHRLHFLYCLRERSVDCAHVLHPEPPTANLVSNCD